MNTHAVIPNSEVIFKPAHRVNHALTASLEKQALQWMAFRAPRWLSSDQLTVLGLSAQIGAGIGYALSHYNRYALLLVILCLVLNWFGDSMDGTLARVRCQQRPRYGFYVDHMVDIFGCVALMCGLGFSGFVQLSQGIFGPTEIRILLILGNLALLRSPYSTVFGHRMLLFDLGGTIAAVCMFATVILLAVRHTAQLYREEPLA
jgi:archaetidylinositol phosphate synthase